MKAITCPICGDDDVSAFYYYGFKVVGCDNCIDEILAEDLPTQEQRKEAAEDMRLDESRGK